MAPWKEIRLSASPAASDFLGSSRGMNVRDAGPATATKQDCTATTISSASTGRWPAKPCTASSTEQAAWPAVAAR